MDAEKNEGDTQQDKGDASLNAEPIVEKTTVTPEKKSDSETPTDNTLKYGIDRKVMLFTGLIAFANVVLMAITIFQACDNHKAIASADATSAKQFELAQAQFAEFKRVNDKTIALSDSLVKSSKENTRTFKDASEKENRAFITPVNPRISFLPDGSAQIDVDWHNIGKTPAYNFRAVSRPEVSSTIPNPRTSGFTNGLQNRVPIIVMANSESISIHQIFPKYPLDAVRVGAASLYVYGCAIYDDIYGRHHYTHYCFVFDFGSKALGPKGNYNDAN